MPLYSKESLENLRHRTDLVEVISSHVDLKRSGAVYKGLCPFHDEKTPSFSIQQGAAHYHCFGCGAHGDAIQFLMTHSQMGFGDAVELLAEKFQVHLEVVQGGEKYQGPSKQLLKDALSRASLFFHCYLLHTPEGHEAANYLFSRGITLDFIRRFQIGLAPKQGMLRKFLLYYKFSDEVMEAAGLIKAREMGEYRDFFIDRITFPILNPTGAIIGFSARKYKEETFGGKYVNTSETPLFKKSRVLFGLNQSRRRIAKERQAIIVEGQIDALRLIDEGFDYTVAGQGTAFGEGHVQELLNLGLERVYLALDSDLAGKEATLKIGDFFQKEGVDVIVVKMPEGSDPDTLLREEGSDAFADLMEHGEHYLDFLIHHYKQTHNVETPAGKTQVAGAVSDQIRKWKHRLMVHESLSKVAKLLGIPESMLDVGQDYQPNIYFKRQESIGRESVNPERILETDFLRWLLVAGANDPFMEEVARQNVRPEDLHDSPCRRVYTKYRERIENGEPIAMLDLIEEEEDQQLLASLDQKKIETAKAERHFIETVKKILDRNWMKKREEIRVQIQSGQLSDEKALLLLKDFDLLKRNPPEVFIPEQHVLETV